MNIFKPDILFIESENSEPYFNMACEEYFLNLTDENKINGTLRFYHWSKKSISIGLFFNTDNLNNDNGKIKKNILPFFKESFKDYFNLIEYQLSNKDINSINKLAKEKYANDKWTFKK